MTLVFQRPSGAGPQTHAFILGCGRFPKLGPGASREATVAGARAVVRHLLDQQDNLVAPLGSVECLLSDPAVALGADVLGLGAFANDPRADDQVDAVITQTVQAAGGDWLMRCQDGDHMFFYMASHGVADQNLTAAGLFEDVLTNKYKKWAASLNVNALCANLPVTNAGACWVFLDACQEIIPELFGNNNGLAGVSLVEASATEISNVKVRAVGLAGSLFGQKAWAPTGAQPPYFTQALLKSFNSCVDRRNDGSWVVTADKLLFNVTKVAEASFGYAAMGVESLSTFAVASELMVVPNPTVPVVVRTKNLADMAAMIHVEVSDGVSPPIAAAPQLADCFLEVPPSGLVYQATGVFTPPTAYPPTQFFALPCAQIVQLTP